MNNNIDLDNLILRSDSYKFSQAPQYPKEMTYFQNYMESRGGKFNYTVFNGLQPILCKYLQGKVVTKEKIDFAEFIVNQHFGKKIFERERWEYILEKYDGRLPIHIKAVKEGAIVQCHNVLMTCESLDPKCAWLVSPLEGLLMKVWYPSTVATLSRECKRIILQGIIDTGGDVNGIDFKLHDFGYRACTCEEQAMIGGTAHLLNFMGTDTIIALPYIMKYYNTDSIFGFSIMASEHSTITSWGKSKEKEAYENLMDTFPDGGLACVIDSWDALNAVSDIIGTQLKDKVIQRNGFLVLRPDSGDVIQTLLAIFNIIGEKFGYSTNKEGFKIFPSFIRVIQGDGVNIRSIQSIINVLKENKWCIDNIAFGMGGKLLQSEINRDTQNFAIKCNLIKINKTEVGVFKSPKELNEKGEYQQSFKQSKPGKLVLLLNDNNCYDTKIVAPNQELSEDDISNNQLVTVFEMGDVVKEYTFEEIKENAKLIL